MINKAVILAGGKGTRMLPYTKACPKEMLPLGDKPALHYVVEEAVNAGITEVLIVVSPDKGDIIKYFTYDETLERELALQGKSQMLDDLNRLTERVDIKFITQYEADGTGGAVLLSEDFSEGEPVLIMNGDDIMTGDVASQIVKVYEKYEKPVIAVSEVSEDELRNCGSVKIVEKEGREMKICDVVEKPSLGGEYSKFASQGRYVATNEVYSYLKTCPRKGNGELYLTDAFAKMAQDGGAYAYDFEGERYDFGNKAGYLEAVIDFALRDKNMENDVKKLLLKYRG